MMYYLQFKFTHVFYTQSFGFRWYDFDILQKNIILRQIRALKCLEGANIFFQWHNFYILIMLSHTWVRYPGFSGHVVKCPILTSWFQDFRQSDWLYHSEQMGPIWGSVPCHKNIFFVWNKLFLGEITFSHRRTHPVKSLWWQIVPVQESANEWKNLTIFGLAVLNGKTSNSEVPIDKINIEILEIFQNLRNIARFNLKLFYQI